MSTDPKNLEFTQVEIHQVVIKKKMLAEVEDVTSDELVQWLDQGTTNDSDLDEQCEEIVDEAEMLDELEPYYYSDIKGTTEYSYSMSDFADSEVHSFQGGRVEI